MMILMNCGDMSFSYNRYHCEPNEFYWLKRSRHDNRIYPGTNRLLFYPTDKDYSLGKVDPILLFV